MRLVPLFRRYWKFTGCASLCLVAAACSSSSTDSNPFAQAGNVFTKPDWATFSGSKSKASAVVTAEDLVGTDGSCAGGAPVPEAPAPEPAAEPEPPATNGANPKVPAPAANQNLLQPAVGLPLGLSECDVVRRAGHPENIEVGNDDRGERSVVLTYLHGERAGIYRFRSGRLFTIERIAAVEEPKKPVKPKVVSKPVRRAAKPAPKADALADPQTPAPKTAASGAAASGSSAPPWPAPSQQPAAGQTAPWPAQQQQQNPQSTVWPSAPKPPSG